ncbi:hypothetical protein P170DRAFT_473887 [Aspergillus steynii IBT 23096]|uniref:Uncharacterized protein n=1 Tax=Aspergillus steynii IBT 23096 TaxID=1392250 RepID=A0A2I2GBR6_9EURO|nr:uncharacterized protein P170DRAFT_473887 [Aspergillus steynii IBT 23096]PLB50324.1 hypothetical protein P170DRAFT_473887 [Aspergillus steynii IBT 23096]
MKLSGFWMRHVALGLVCLLLLSAFQTASALPAKGKGVGSHRSGSGKGSHGLGGLLSGHDSKKTNGKGKTDDKKGGLGGLFGHDDKKGGKGKTDDKKGGLGGLFGHDDKKDGKGKTDDKKGGLGGLFGHDDKKDGKGKTDDKKGGLGGLFGHDDKKDGKGKTDDKKGGLGGLFGHDDKKDGKGKGGTQNPGKGKPKPGKDPKNGKDKCKTTKGGSRGSKPSPRDLAARDLAIRAGTLSVAQDDMKNTQAKDKTLQTDKLRTCIGVAITGGGGIFDHWLLHVSATKGQADSAISKVDKDWSLMGPKKDVEIYISSPDPDPCKSDAAARDLIEQSQTIAKHIETELKKITGGGAKVFHRPARDNPSGHEGTMEVDGDGKVYVEGKKVN